MGVWLNLCAREYENRETFWSCDENQVPANSQLDTIHHRKKQKDLFYIQLVSLVDRLPWKFSHNSQIIHVTIRSCIYNEAVMSRGFPSTDARDLFIFIVSH